jgi:hypothetical protein
MSSNGVEGIVFIDGGILDEILAGIGFGVGIDGFLSVVH